MLKKLISVLNGYSFQPAVLYFLFNLLLQSAPSIKPIWLISIGTLHGLARAFAKTHDAVRAWTAGPAPELPLHEFVRTQVGPVIAIEFKLIRAVRRSPLPAAHSIDNLDLLTAFAFALKFVLNLLNGYLCHMNHLPFWACKALCSS